MIGVILILQGHTIKRKWNYSFINDSVGLHVQIDSNVNHLFLWHKKFVPEQKIKYTNKIIA